MPQVDKSRQERIFRAIFNNQPDLWVPEFLLFGRLDGEGVALGVEECQDEHLARLVHDAAVHHLDTPPFGVVPFVLIFQICPLVSEAAIWYNTCRTPQKVHIRP